jgi:hypothetical protein
MDMNGTVEQIGTSHNCNDDVQQNSAWFEMYPNGAYEITGFPVDNGDVISARIGYKGDNTFKMVLLNHTQGISTTVPSSYTVSTTALRSSAEWIVEAPYSTSILPLSDFQLVTFNNCSAVIDGFSGTISSGNWQSSEITMTGANGAEAQPSAPIKKWHLFPSRLEAAMTIRLRLRLCEFLSRCFLLRTKGLKNPLQQRFNSSRYSVPKFEMHPIMACEKTSKFS